MPPEQAQTLALRSACGAALQVEEQAEEGGLEHHRRADERSRDRGCSLVSRRGDEGNEPKGERNATAKKQLQTNKNTRKQKQLYKGSDLEFQPNPKNPKPSKTVGCSTRSAG